MDERGIQEGACESHWVLSATKKKKAYVTVPDSNAWVSVIEAVNAEGRHIRPLVIFKGNGIQANWFLSKEEVPDWVFTYSENAWTSNEIALNCLKEIFLPETRPDDGSPRMLDGGDWELKVRDPNHNHKPSSAYAHPCHRREERKAVMEPIKQHLTAGLKASKSMALLRPLNLTRCR